MLQHLSYHGCLHPALLSLFSSQRPPEHPSGTPLHSRQRDEGSGRSGGGRGAVGNGGKGASGLESRFSQFVAALQGIPDEGA